MSGPDSASSIGNTADLFAALMERASAFSAIDDGRQVMHDVLQKIIDPLYEAGNREAANRLFDAAGPKTLEEFGELHEISWNPESADLVQVLRTLPDIYSSAHALWSAAMNRSPLVLTLDEKHDEFKKLAVLLSPRNLLRMHEVLDDEDDRALLKRKVDFFALPQDVQVFNDLLLLTDIGWTQRIASSWGVLLAERLSSLDQTRRLNALAALTIEQRRAWLSDIDMGSLRRQLSSEEFVSTVAALSSDNPNASPESFLQRVCPPGQKVMVSDSLYFGTDIPGGGRVSTGQWDEFFKSEITTRFPLGSTAWKAHGQWMSQEGIPIREDSMVVNFMHERAEPSERAIVEIQAAYERRFQQEAVLRAWNEKCVSFNLLN